MNNKLDLKNWIRGLVLESIDFDETYNDYQIEVDNISIPGLVDTGTMVTISMDVNYNTNQGHPEQGQFGSPEKSVQGEGSSIEIVNAVPVTITIEAQESVVRTLRPEQVAAVKEYVANYLSDSEQDIINAIQKSQELAEVEQPSVVQPNLPDFRKFKQYLTKSFRNSEGQNFENVHISEQTDNITIELYFKLIKQSVIENSGNTLSKILKLTKILKAETRMFCSNNFICIELKTHKNMVSKLQEPKK